MHGREAADKAAATAQKTFEQGTVAEGLPTIEIPNAELAGGTRRTGSLRARGPRASNSEARRQIQGGAVKVNDKAVSDEKASIGAGDVGSDGVIKLSLGKKKHVLLRPVS